MVLKTKHVQSLLSLFLGCSVIVKNQGATVCNEADPPRCEATTLIICEAGFEALVPCSDGCAALPESHCTICGDGIPEAPETCDDGNNIINDGCEPSCQISPDCGDGAVQTGEQCDDANQVANDGCSATCQFEICGDGIEQANEECDDGNNDNTDACRSDCRDINGAPGCGDGLPDDGETCDDGNNVSGDGCSFDCSSTESCGNGKLDVNENCELTDSGCVSCELFDSCGNLTSDAGELCFDTPGQELSLNGFMTAGAKFFSLSVGVPFFAVARTQGGQNFVDTVRLEAGNFAAIPTTSNPQAPTVLMTSGRLSASLNESFVGLENDGRLYVGSFTGTANLTESASPKNLPPANIIKQLELADMNGDLAADLIILEPAGVEVLFENSADGSCDPFCDALTLLATPAPNPVRMAIADMNNDTLPDVIVASEGNANTEGSIQVFINAFPSSFTLAAEVTVGIGSFSFVGLVAQDFDGDSDIDIVVACDGNGNAKDKLLVIENIGSAVSPSLPAFGTATTPLISVGGVGLAALLSDDVDKDGTSDLIASTKTSGDIIVLQKSGALQSAAAFSVLARYASRNQSLLLAFNGLLAGDSNQLVSLFAGGVEVLFSFF
jgi:cysteine-rich repeat protein